jgi:hypothetical protein
MKGNGASIGAQPLSKTWIGFEWFHLVALLWWLMPLDSSAQVFPGPLPPGVAKVGETKHPGIIESSGMTLSGRHPNILWTHNDTENPTFLFAMTTNGAHLGAYELQGANPVDLEAIEWHDGCLYLADTGTNGMVRSHSAIYKVAEPDISKTFGRAVVDHTWYVRFPGGRQDSEGFFIWQGYGYLVSKYETNNAVDLHRFSLADDSESVLLERVGSLPATADVSEATLSRDGNRLALLTENGLEVLFLGGNLGLARVAQRGRIDLENETLEAGAFIGDGYLATGELYPDILLFSGTEVSGAPVFEGRLLSVTVFEGNVVRFSSPARGFPAPVYQWIFNGAPIVGATNESLHLPAVTLSDAGSYEILARNAAGEIRRSATLTVLATEADLRITEVMSSPSPVSEVSADWWELTNFGTAEADLGGWRFNDSTGGLNDAFVIPAGVMVRPGESVVFVEQLSADEFKGWWGAGWFSPSNQIVTFSGSQLSFRAAGDSLRVWDDETVNDEAVLLRVDFGQAIAGASFGYDPESETFGQISREGENGAFRAASGGDIGSPSRVGDSPKPGIVLGLERHSGGVEITVKSPGAGSYALEYSEDLKDWTPIGIFSGSTNGVEQGGSAPLRIFRARIR